MKKISRKNKARDTKSVDGYGDWSLISSNSVTRTYRMEVPHGCLILAQTQEGNSMCYVPDKR